jgi:hypothetical protein
VTSKWLHLSLQCDLSDIPVVALTRLSFGLILHPQYAPEVYLEAATARESMLSREHHGARAILNALERLSDTYGTTCISVRQDLTIAEAQLRDYQARLGQPFQQDSYMSTLTALRHQLKLGLSGGTSEPADQPQPSVSELAERIKALKASHTIEGTPQRVRNRRASAEQPVTARIRGRAESIQRSLVGHVTTYPVSYILTDSSGA